MVLRNLWPYIVVFSFIGFLLWFLRLDFILNVNLALQPCAYICWHNKASRSLFIVVDIIDGIRIAHSLIDSIESVGSSVWRQSSSCKV